MSRQLRIDFPGAIHHITSRGNERRIIYRDDRDRHRFLEILEEVGILRRWILHAWVLMSNHYHLLIETPEVGLSRGMKKLNESYARWFNERHRRVGHLFQGRFKNILVERESHQSKADLQCQVFVFQSDLREVDSSCEKRLKIYYGWIKKQK